MKPFQNIRKFLGHAALSASLGIFCALLVLLVLKQTGQPGFEAFPLKGWQPAVTTAPPDSGDKLNLNTASLKELMTLPGIGSELAERIVRQRDLQPFLFLEDLRTVKGIGERRIEQLRDLAYVPFPEGFD